METRDPGHPGEFGQNQQTSEEEERFGEEAHAYNQGRAVGRNHSGDNLQQSNYDRWRGDDTAGLGDYGQRGFWRGDEAHADAPGEGTGGMATSSAVTGTGTAAGMGTAYGSADENLPFSGGADGGDHGAISTVNSGSDAGLSSGNPAGLSTGTMTGDDADWQRQRAGFQEHFTGRSQSFGQGGARRNWEEAEPNYRYGYEAARSGRYEGRRFDEVEAELRRDYEGRAQVRGGQGKSIWEHLRDEIRAGFEHLRKG